MRFTPAAILLTSALALSASSSIGKEGAAASVATVSRASAPSPAAAAWTEHGLAAIDAGNLPAAREAYESALLLSPGDPSIYFALGRIARAQQMPGRAIKYFDDVLRLDPKNQFALQEQGLAMMDKGAIESARQTLADLQKMCAKNCAVAEPLAAAIAAGPPKYVTAEVSAPVKTSPLAKD